MTIEEYAIDLVAGGAESTAEDDMNEDGEVADEDHEAAMDLAIQIAHAIRANPGVVLALVDRGPLATPGEGGSPAPVLIAPEFSALTDAEYAAVQHDGGHAAPESLAHVPT